MIQNIEPHVYRNEYVPEPPKEDSVILYYEGRKILVKIEDQEISFQLLLSTPVGRYRAGTHQVPFVPYHLADVV